MQLGNHSQSGYLVFKIHYSVRNLKAEFFTEDRLPLEFKQTVCISLPSSGKGYRCTGNISEWTKCTFRSDEPERKPFIVPDELKDQVS